MTTKNTEKTTTTTTTTSSMALFTLRLCDYLSIADNAGGLRGREGAAGGGGGMVRYASAEKRPQ